MGSSHTQIRTKQGLQAQFRGIRYWALSIVRGGDRRSRAEPREFFGFLFNQERGCSYANNVSVPSGLTKSTEQPSKVCVGSGVGKGLSSDSAGLRFLDWLRLKAQLPSSTSGFISAR